MRTTRSCIIGLPSDQNLGWPVLKSRCCWTSGWRRMKPTTASPMAWKLAERMPADSRNSSGLTSDTWMSPLNRWAGIGVATANGVASFVSVSRSCPRWACGFGRVVDLHALTGLGRGHGDPALATEGEGVKVWGCDRCGVDRARTRDLGFSDAAMRVRAMPRVGHGPWRGGGRGEVDLARLAWQNDPAALAAAAPLGGHGAH